LNKHSNEVLHYAVQMDPSKHQVVFADDSLTLGERITVPATYDRQTVAFHWQVKDLPLTMNYRINLATNAFRVWPDGRRRSTDRGHCHLESS